VILVDSSVWIDFFRGVSHRHTDQLADWLDATDDAVDIGVADLVVFEVLRGFSSAKDQKHAKELLMALDVVEIGGVDNALRAADHYRVLRQSGYTIRSPIDVLLASYCVRHGHQLLHRDADFDVMQRLRGLKVWGAH
jgi:predicted nucleic acid-binding protein